MVNGVVDLDLALPYFMRELSTDDFLVTSLWTGLLDTDIGFGATSTGALGIKHRNNIRT